MRRKLFAPKREEQNRQPPSRGLGMFEGARTNRIDESRGPLTRCSQRDTVGTLTMTAEYITAQQEIQASNRSLERSNRDLQHFASVLAHDLQSPLATIGSMSAWLMEEYHDSLDANAQEYLGYMGKAVQRMNALVSAALQYSSAGAAAGESAVQVDSGEIFDWTRMTLYAEIAQLHAVITCDQLPTVACGEHALVQVFQNLISNALRYSAPGLVPRIHVSALHSGNEWTFSVADNGIGIDPADVEQVFELFQRLNPEKGGIGIGLSICRRVVENLGGRIWVESELGKGSTFRFTVPDPAK